MSHRHSRHIRLVVLSLVALIAAALAPSLADATPGHPAPTIASVQKELNKIQAKNAALVEKYNKAQVDLRAKKQAAAKAQALATAATAAFNQAREAVSATALAEYQGGSFSTAGALFSGSSQQSYLDSLNTQSMIANHTAAVAKRLDASKAAADRAVNAAKALVKDAAARVAAMKKQQIQLAKAFSTWNKKLNSLNAAQRRAYQNTINTPVTAPQVAMIKLSVNLADAPAAAKKAVDFALDQRGKSYVFGAAGPDVFDCSGLTMAAYASAGIQLPHSAADQYNYGTHVSLNDLRPGDLIFYYQPIGHVVIYVGDGQAVSASTEGVPIGLIDVSGWEQSNITGATRIVG